MPFGTGAFRTKRPSAPGDGGGKPDGRSPAKHDRDRILYSPHFLRLSSVTQVVGVREKQIFHNRLTHTLKVAQVGRRLAEKLLASTPRRQLLPLGGLDPDTVEAACLAHDLGHPPFGHVAEEALDDILSKTPLDGYEGNAQSFRIVTKLAYRRAGQSGLDLTRATLAAILKYPWQYRRGPAASDPKKFGAYFSETGAFDFARAGAAEYEPTLEARIMDWADDITYAVHDLEDFFRAGLTPLDRLRMDGRETQAYVDATSRYVAERGRDPRRFAAAFDGIRTRFPREPYAGSAEERIYLHGMSSGLIGYFIGAPRIESEAWRLDDDYWYEMTALKRLTWHFVITGPGLSTLQRGQKTLIRELHKALDDWVSEAWDKPDEQRRLPAGVRNLLIEGLRDKEARAIAKDESEIRLRAVTDFIAGLTEDQVVGLHQRLLGGEALSALEPWLHR
jgi:dGTPase